MKRKDRKAKKTATFLRWVFGSFLVGLLVGIITIGLVWFLWGNELKKVSAQIDHFQPRFTTRIYDSKGRLVDEVFVENREFASLDEIPEILKKAFIASEDQHFYSHPGVDLTGIVRALLANIARGWGAEGASTITQQLARNQFLELKKTFDRKIKEALLAILLERKYPKEKILEAYLNQIYFGHGAYGVKSAARVFFGKDLSELNLAECAMLTGIARSPYNFSPYINFEAAQRQQRRVLERMQELGFITQEQKEKALATPIVLSGLEKKHSPAPYFTDFVLKELLKLYDEEIVFGGGLKVYTTLDLDLQKKAEETLLESGFQGAVLCMDPTTGFIKAMVGGRDYQESKFNRAYQAYRQPGSTFKPFIYTAAMDSGFTPSSTIIDEPITFPNGWEPQNYDRRFSGEVTLREGLEKSINIVAIKLLQEVGINKVIEYARKMGIQGPLRKDLSLALGTSEVTLLELVKAYSAFANQGKVPQPVAILRVEDFDGRVIYSGSPAIRQAISPQTAYVMARLMEGVILRGTGRRAYFGRPAGGKTGTTEDYVDAWFIGFSPQLVCGVFLGNDDRTPLGPSRTGGVIAAPIFKKIMEVYHRDLPVEDFVRPSGVVELEVCAESGLLPASGCPRVKVAFKEGTEPTFVCNQKH